MRLDYVENALFPLLHHFSNCNQILYRLATASNYLLGAYYALGSLKSSRSFKNLKSVDGGRV